MKPKFGTLWPADKPWPYDPQAGVGLLLVGRVTEPDLFVDMLGTHGCHPAATQRIIKALDARGQIQLTVQSTLNFVAVEKDMDWCNVRMTIIEPQADWVQTHNDGAWPETLLERVQALRKERRQEH